MDLASLTLLVEIIDAGNLSLAARKLRMTRANVSYHLGQLEKNAGVQLVRRTTRRAAARTSGSALPIAIPSPTFARSSASLVSSPTAAISSSVAWTYTDMLMVADGAGPSPQRKVRGAYWSAR